MKLRLIYIDKDVEIKHEGQLEQVEEILRPLPQCDGNYPSTDTARLG